MRTTFLIGLILYAASARATQWTQTKCVPDYFKMGMRRGLLVSTKGCPEPICDMTFECAMVDSDTARRYFGQFDKIPPEKLSGHMFWTQSHAICLTDNGHCPDAKVCFGAGDDDPGQKHYVGMKWDDPVALPTGNLGYGQLVPGGLIPPGEPIPAEKFMNVKVAPDKKKVGSP